MTLINLDESNICKPNCPFYHKLQLESTEKCYFEEPSSYITPGNPCLYENFNSNIGDLLIKESKILTDNKEPLNKANLSEI